MSSNLRKIRKAAILVASHDRVGHALWNMATTAGLTVGVVNWWVTYPPEKVDGVVVSDHFMPSVVKGREVYFDAATGDAAPIAYPFEWQARVRDLLRERRKGRVLPFADLTLPGWVSDEILGGHYLVSLPAYDAMYREIGNADFEIIAINVDADTEDGLYFLEDHPVSYPVLADPDGDIGIPYGIRTLPVAYLLDRNGYIVQSFRNFKSGDEVALKQQIESRLQQ